jgi:hypothetical protein
MHGGLPPRYFRIPCTANVQDDGYLSMRDIKSANDVPYRVRRDYHILLSQTWQVPVLYFSAFWEETLEPLTLNEIYKILVDKSSEEAIKDVSIMGGISHGVDSLVETLPNMCRIIRFLGLLFTLSIRVVLRIF